MELNKAPGVVNLYAHFGRPVHPNNAGGFLFWGNLAY